MVEHKTYPVDSCLAAFSNKEVSISLDYGWYSDPSGQAEWDTQYSRAEIRINGRKAELITSVIDTQKLPTKNPMETEVHLVTHGPKNNEAGMITSLLFTITTRKSIDQNLVKRIYESIRYLED
jgi:hypothetical protein